jgi:hypothetical protein
MDTGDVLLIGGILPSPTTQGPEFRASPPLTFPMPLIHRRGYRLGASLRANGLRVFLLKPLVAPPPRVAC